ncbi:MAG TPA: TonB-dependent receptor plug domain-containing protein, partial [Prevotella sp.]
MKKNAFMFAMLACIATANAANPKTEKLDTLKAYELQNIQVLSTRANKKTPMAYSDLNKQQIKEINHGKDIPQLLEMTPSVTTSSDAGMGIGYTGIHVRGTDPTRINVTANGIPMNDAESSGLYWVNMGDFASSVESMQIQRGVGTSTNGAGAFGATLNLQTENIGAKAFGSVDLSAGSYGTHKETFRFGTGLLGGHWGFQGRLSNIGSDGYIDRASTRLNSYFLQGGYFGDNTMVKFITFNGTEKTYHAWDYASKADMAKYGRTYNPSGMYTDANGKPTYYDNQTDNYHQQHYYLIWDQRLNASLNLHSALHYTHGFGYYEQYKADSEDSHVKL